MLNALLKLSAPSHRRKDFIDAFQLVAGPTRVKKGCLSFRFYQDLENPDEMLLYEEWNSLDAFTHHLRSEQYRVILSLVDLSSKAPEIQINRTSQTIDLQSIFKVFKGEDSVLL